MPSLQHTLPVQAGAVVDGKYELLRVIGEGGMGVVFEARHRVLGERVALKFLLAKTDDREARERFVREAKASSRIRGENVTRVADVGYLPTGEPFMVMELLEGCDLSKRLAGGPLPMTEAIEYVLQACRAIAEAHDSGIVHRDLKPANLFLTRRADQTPLVKVLDFGISKLLDEEGEGLTKTHTAMGSAPYMSPEQMRSTKLADARTDVYAMGITLFELLSGKRPFQGESTPQLCAEILTGTPVPLRSLRPDLPDALAWIIERAFARDPNARFQSIAELAQALAPFAGPGAAPITGRVFSSPGFDPRLVPQSGGVAAMSAPRVFSDPAAAIAPTALGTPSAMGATGTNASISHTQRPPPKRSGGAVIVTLAGIGSLLVLGAIGFFVATRRTGPDATSVAATGETAQAATAATAAPTATPTVAPAPSDPDPAEAAGASATASAAAAPAATAPRGGARGGARPRGAPAPAGKPTSKPKDIFDGRQ